jgi:Uma2 family endonuclease
VPQFLEIIELESLGEERFELIQGWIVPTEAKSPLHATVLEICSDELREPTSDKRMVRNQRSIETSDSILEPDISVVKASYRAHSFRRYPTGQELLLVVEFADRTLERDRRKAQIYAAAGVPVCWIVNVRDHSVEVHDRADDSITYSRVRQLRGAD